MAFIENPVDTSQEVKPGFRTEIQETEPGMKWLVIIDREHPNGDQEGHMVPLAAIASWRELLGYDDPIEALEAILRVQDFGEPDPCPETGRNAFTDCYTVLEQREHAREAEAEAAVDEGDDPDMILTLSSAAAYNETHVPINGGECLFDRVRRQARDEMGLPHPSRKCGESSRLEPPVMGEKPTRLMRVFQPAQSRRAMLMEALEGQEEELLRCTQQFLHLASGHERDELAPPEPEPGPTAPETFDELLAQYQEAA